MDTPEGLDQSLRELRDANRALADEGRALRLAVVAAERGRRRLLPATLAVTFGLPALGCAGILLFRPVPPGGESVGERYERQERERVERTERALDRAEAILGRWEKVAPRE